MTKKGPYTPRVSFWETLIQEVTNQAPLKTTYFYQPKNLNAATNPLKKTSTYSKKTNPTLPKRFQLKEPYTHIYLTTREIESLQAIITEKTIAAAAQKLQLSPRTIEFYFENVKKKLSCKKKKEILDLVQRYKLVE